MRLFLVLLSLAWALIGSAQNVGINATGAAPAASAILDVSSTTSGLLTPRMTAAQRTGIAAPATGLLVYQTDAKSGFWYFNGVIWVRLGIGVETYQLYGNAPVNITTLNNWIVMPGLSQTIVVGTASKVYIHTDGGIQTQSTAAAGYTIVDVAIHQNGTVLPDAGYKRVAAANNAGLVTMIAHYSMDVILDVSPGTHTFDIRGTGQQGSIGLLGGNSTSVLQGSLSILVVPQ